MNHLIIATSRWQSLSWFEKLRLRVRALRSRAVVRPHRYCPPRYMYLYDPNQVVTAPANYWSTNVATPADPLTMAAMVETYGKVLLRHSPEPIQGKITRLTDQ